MLVGNDADPGTDASVDPAVDAATELRRLQQAQAISRVGSWHYDIATDRFSATDTLLDMYGLDRGALARGYAALDECIHPDDRDVVRVIMNGLISDGEPVSVRYRLRPPNLDTERWVFSRGVAERDASGTVTTIVGTICDVTDLVTVEMEARQAHAELVQAHNHHEAVVAATPDAIHIYDLATGRYARANRSGNGLIGFTEETVRVLCGRDLEILVPDSDRRAFERELKHARRAPDGEVLSTRHRVRHDDGVVRWLSRRLTPFARDDAGRVTQVLVMSRDVTDVVEMESRLEQAALHDELTGLANRRLIRDRLEQALLRSTRGGHVAVLICDLDGFKRINDSHGHRAGDEVLREVAKRLVAATRAGDAIARMGGDEFAVVLEIAADQNPAELAETIARRIAIGIAAPMVVDGVEHAVSTSIGIRLADGAATSDDLLNDADAAMYYIKGHGANGHAFFAPFHRADVAALDLLERQIRRALSEDAVGVDYQPIVDPRTGAVEGVEALLRIRDEHGRLLNTGDVVEVAERTGMIIPLDEQVLRIACAQVATWRRRPELAGLVLKVNRSARDITRPGFHQRIVDALELSGLEPHVLTIEITETVLLDATEESLADLRSLNALGVGLAVDDFGTGYASLRYLAEMPITCIKIDRSFTARLPDDPTSTTLVRATIGLAEQLGISCIAEGVETTAQLDALLAYDRLLIQGYLFARPQSGAHAPPSHVSIEARGQLPAA